MRERLHRLFKRHGKKAWLFVGLGMLVVAGIGGGAYAALGGVGRVQTSSDIELQRGLVGWWKLNGDTKDATPYADNGSIAGSPTLTSDREGKSGGAYLFNGSTDNITIPDTANLEPTAGITMSVWTQLHAVSHNVERIADKLNSTGYSLYQTGPASADTCGVSNLCWKVNISGTAQVITIPLSGLTAGNWYNFTGTYDGTNLRLYVDGVLKATSGTLAGTISNTTGPLCLGVASSNTSCSTSNTYAGGAIDDVRIWSRALSSNEVGAASGEYDPGLQAASGENGLIGWWKLDGDAKDATPYANNGVATGTAAVADRKGRASGALSFNGTTDKVVVNNFNSSVLMQGAFSASWTMSVWTKYSGGATSRIIFGKQGNNGGLLIDANGFFAFQIRDSGAINHFISSNSSDTTKWHHLVGVYAAGAMTFYMDGQLVGTTSTPSILNYAATLDIGDGDTNNAWAYPGNIDDARVYNRALNATEVKALYDSYDSQINLNASPTSTVSGGNINAGLVGYWPFNGSAKDATPYSHNGTVTAATLTADRKGYANSAYNFNSASALIQMDPTADHRPTAGVTVSVWINPSNIEGTGVQAIVGNLQNGGYNIVINSSGAVNCPSDVKFNVYVNGAQRQTCVPETILTDGTWAHIVGTFDGTNVKLYVNDILRDTNNYPGSITYTSLTTPLCVGLDPGASSCSGSPFQGSINDIRIYNRALSAGEVQALYNSSN